MQGRILKFSIIIPLYNKEISIRSTIDSVLNQTWPHFELIIVNDGSTDRSLEVLQTFTDSRIRIINQANCGASNARNMGILESKNEFIVFLDADDLWTKDCLEEFTLLINNYPLASVFITNYNMTGKNFQGSERNYYVWDFYYLSAAFMAKWSLSFMLMGCVATKRECFSKVGFFLDGVTNGEDVDMWIRLANRFILAKSEKVTTLYRTDTENRNYTIKSDDRSEPKKEILIKQNVRSKSMQLFYGVDFTLKFRRILRSKDKKSILSFIMYRDWIARALWLIIKYRILGISIKIKHIYFSNIDG